MVDEVPPAKQPIVVDPSAVATMASTAFRQIALIVSGSATVIGFAKGRNLHGIAAWLTSDDFTPYLTAMITLAVFVYGQARMLWNKAKLLTAAEAAPDNVAIVLPRLPLRERIVALWHRITA